MSLTIVAGIILALAVVMLFLRQDRSQDRSPNPSKDAPEPRRAPDSGPPPAPDLEAQIAARTRFWSASDHALFAWLLDAAAADTGAGIANDPLARMRVLEAADKLRQLLETEPEAEVNLPFLAADAKGPKHFVRKVRRGEWMA